MREGKIKLDDGRRVKAEVWTEDGYTYLSYCFSVNKIEKYNKKN
ncbi:MAG: hypothetical protein ACOCRK_10870 [bacterium]